MKSLPDIVLGVPAGKDGEDGEDSEKKSPDELSSSDKDKRLAAHDLIDAVNERDPDKLVSALELFYRACDAEHGDDGDDDGSDY